MFQAWGENEGREMTKTMHVQSEGADQIGVEKVLSVQNMKMQEGVKGAWDRMNWSDVVYCVCDVLSLD